MAKKGPIDRLKRRLYTRGDVPAARRRRGSLNARATDLPETWKREEPEESPKSHTILKMEKPKKKFFTLGRVVLVAFIFFVLSMGAAAYFFFGGGNVISTRNVAIAVEGPTSINGGEELILDVIITNKNATNIELADLIVEYPDGTRAAGNLSLELPRERVSIGTLAPGEETRTMVRAIVFGEENSTRRIDFSVEYRVPGSNAIFVSEGSYTIGITSAPLSVSVEGQESAIAGQDIAFDILVSSNADSVIRDALVVVNYPFGFSFQSANPTPRYGENTWSLGDLQPGAERTISIRGVLEGQESEERTFRIDAGVAKEGDPRDLATAFITNTYTVEVQRPFLALNVAVNGDTAQTYTAQSDERTRVDVSWQNTTTERVFDARIELRLSGSAFDPSSVEVSRGFYNSNTNTITWNPQTLFDLSEIGPGGTGTVNFTFRPRSRTAGGTLIERPQVVLLADVEGRRPSTGGRAPEAVRSSAERTVKVESDITLDARAMYTTGPFTNSGPLPPRVGSETTYTVRLAMENGSNPVVNAELETSLPSYVRWIGSVSPGSAAISYNTVGGRVQWNVGSLDVGERAEVAFQVAFTPSSSQIETTPVLVNAPSISARDRFTNSTISGGGTVITTRLTGDPGASLDDAEVVE